MSFARDGCSANLNGYAQWTTLRDQITDDHILSNSTCKVRRDEAVVIPLLQRLLPIPCLIQVIYLSRVKILVFRQQI